MRIMIYQCKIDNWLSPITVGVYEQQDKAREKTDAEELCRITFKVPSNVKIEAIPTGEERN